MGGNGYSSGKGDHLLQVATILPRVAGQPYPMHPLQRPPCLWVSIFWCLFLALYSQPTICRTGASVKNWAPLQYVWFRWQAGLSLKVLEKYFLPFFDYIGRTNFGSQVRQAGSGPWIPVQLSTLARACFWVGARDPAKFVALHHESEGKSTLKAFARSKPQWWEQTAMNLRCRQESELPLMLPAREGSLRRKSDILLISFSLPSQPNLGPSSEGCNLCATVSDRNTDVGTTNEA